MISSIKKIVSLLDRRQRWLIAGLAASMVGSGIFQLAGVGSVLPFVEVLTNPEVVQEKAGLRQAYEMLGLEEPRAFVFWMGVIVLLLLVGGNAFLLLTQWLIARVTWRIQRDLSRQLLARYLAQPYTAHLKRNSADYGKNILQETQQFSAGVIRPALNLAAALVTALAIVGVLVAVHPVLAGMVAALFGTAYILIYWGLRRKLLSLGRRRVAANTGRFKAVHEAFGSLKEVKVLGREAHFLDSYAESAHRFSEVMALQSIFGQIPRYLVEALAFGSVMVVILYLMETEGGVAGVLPLLSIYALAGYRLLPAFQKIYGGVSQLRFNQAAVDAVHRDFFATSAGRAAQACRAAPEALPFRHEIRLDNVSFTYPGASARALTDVNLTIPHRSFVAFVGATGAGKTTLADVLLGVLVPDAGTFSVDGVPVDDDNRTAWQANLGYVPQEIYLADDTIAANIAYGVPVGKCDGDSIDRAARSANIHEFIVNELPNGYQTRVGERGVRLSGGQRQRIGIARALYHDPEVLVFDEATSALDGATEAAVHRAILEAARVKTVILIAHRLSTVEDCNCVFLLEHGRLKEQGALEELQGSQRFQDLKASSG